MLRRGGGVLVGEGERARRRRWRLTGIWWREMLERERDETYFVREAELLWLVMGTGRGFGEQ
jgi:hypothetical protein